ncbi:MAG: hypothetical protein JSW11_00950 [Candidatus Heimdallarchaeota archaeon]|nr:MAG: hypothetical protein JSW11_00950 [Candidatus Heimdallarchaeota archaeon]
MDKKDVYGAAVNLSGLWGPYKMSWDEECNQYYDKSGEFSVNQLGEYHRDGVIEFASQNKNETFLWASGVKAAMKMLREWAYTGEK